MKKIIVTSGGTSEKIDNVRKITNTSTGKLGMTIANKLVEEYDDIKVYYVCSKTALKPHSPKVEIIEIEGTFDLKNTIENLLQTEHIDYFIHAMAVSDYMTDYVTTLEKLKTSIQNSVEVEKMTDTKISSYEDNLVIVLKPTPKIISLIKNISPSTYLVGFKLLDQVTKGNLICVAQKLRDKNKCDLVVANDLSNIRNGNHKAYILDRYDNIINCDNKEDIAQKLVKKMMSNA